LRYEQFFRGAGAAEGDIDEIIAGRQLEPRRAALGGGNQRQLAIGTGNGAEDAPGEAFLHRLPFRGQLGFHGNFAQVRRRLVGEARRRKGVQLRHFRRCIELLEVCERIVFGADRRCG